MIDSEQRTDGEGTFFDEGKRLALVVGVNGSIESDYLAPLDCAEHDASDMAIALRTSACNFRLFKPVLLGAQATSRAIQDAIVKLIRESTPQDVLCFYFSGHAQPMKLDITGHLQDIYLVTHDFSEKDLEVNPSHHLSLYWLWDTLCRPPHARKTLFILDCCYAGNMPNRPDRYQLDLRRLFHDYYGEKDIEMPTDHMILSATGYNEKAREQNGYGVMTGWLLKALRGEDRSTYDKVGRLDIHRLYSYLCDSMPKEQQPVLSGEARSRFFLAWYPPLPPQNMPDETSRNPVLLMEEFFERWERSTSKDDHLPFDRILCRNASLDDIDMDAVTSLFKEARVQNQRWLPPRMTTQELLEHLSLLQGRGVTNGAILCFGKKPSKWIAQAFIRCTAYKGDNRLEGWNEDQFFHENLLEQYTSSVAFLQRSLCLNRVISAEERVEPCEIPLVVLREAIANALIHREYVDQRHCVHIELYSDRIEISNPGGLFGPFPVKQLGLEGGQYSLRNPHIAYVFYLYNYAEKLGTGIARMQRAMQEARLPQPQFDFDEGSFKVTLFRPQRKGPEMSREDAFLLSDVEHHQVAGPGLPSHGARVETEGEEMLASSGVEHHQVVRAALSSNGAGARVETEEEDILPSSGVEHHQVAGPGLSSNGAGARVGTVEDPTLLVNGAESHTMRGGPTRPLYGGEPTRPLYGGEPDYQTAEPQLPSESPELVGQGTMPSSSSRRRGFVSRRVQLISFVLIILLIIATSSVIVFPGLFPPAPLGIGVINEPHNEQIGLSDGTYAFDTGTDRADASLKKEAATKLAQGDVVGATSLWNQATGIDTSDAEVLISLENQRVLASGSSYITLVVATTLTGSPNNISSGRDDLQGAYVAQKEYNDGLKLGGGRQIRLLIANAGSKKDYVPEVAGQIVQAAKQDPTIVGVMGWYRSAYAQIAIPILTRAHIPMVSSTASADRLSGMSPYFFRVGATNKREAIAGVRYAEQQLHASHVALFVDPKDAYSSNLADDFKQQFVADGNQIVDTENYTVGDKSNLPALLQNALKSNPDLIYFAGYADDLSVLLINLGTSYPNLQILGGDGLYNPNAYSSTARPGMNRVRFTAFAYPDEWSILGLNEPLFFSEYPADFNPTNADHSANPYGFTRADFGVILGYDATFALLKGCQNVLGAGKALTAVNLRGGLAQIAGKNAIQGVSGQISFDSNGDPIDKAVVILYGDPDGQIQLFQPNGVQGCFELGTCV